jgi:hypothetical protein
MKSSKRFIGEIYHMTVHVYLLPGLIGKCFGLTVILFLSFCCDIYPQEEGTSAGRLNVFIDEELIIDADYIRQEIPVVTYVRDREHADVHLIISRHLSGTTGATYNVSFIGYGQYRNMNYQLNYWAPSSNTTDITRRGYTSLIKSGLAPFISAAGSSHMMDVTYREIPAISDYNGIDDRDPWNQWVFDVYAGGEFDREDTRNSSHIRYGIFADRITRESRTRLRPYGNYNERNFRTAEGWVKTSRIRGGFDSYHVVSISDHWSVGGFGKIFISTFDNLKFSAEISPAIEYSLYPYDEATRRSITIAWRAGGGYFNYVEETVFDKTEEILFGQALVASANFRQPWGDIRSGIVGFHHFHDFRSNSIEIFALSNFRIVQGLSLRLNTSFDLINNQVAIPKSDLSLEEILLEQRRRATSSRFGINIGLSYTFGSRVTGVFNPRLNM